ncbi:MAG: hypothetical protein ABII71_00485 [Candidatus Micrarchaeota archaeon]
MYEVLLVLLLSVVPFIENRGALFVGFALGVTDPLIYALGTILNILMVPLYLFIFSKYRLLRNFNVGKLLSTKGPVSFALLIPGTANGANALTCSLLSTNLSFSFWASFAFISIGIVLRGLITFAILVGSLTLAEAANIGNAFSAILFLAMAVFLYPRIREYLKEKKISISWEYWASGLFAVLAILCFVLPSICLVFKPFIDPVAYGISDAKVIAFFAFASIFIFCSAFLKLREHALATFIFLVLLANMITVGAFFLYTYPPGMDLLPVGEAFAVSGPHFSYNTLLHIHTMKPAMVYPLIMAGLEFDETTIDYGIVFLDYVPAQLYLVQFLVLLGALIAIFYSAPLFRTPATKVAALFGAFILLKYSIDGGPLNVPFLAALFLLYFSRHEPKKRYLIKFRFWAAFVGVVVTASLLFSMMRYDAQFPGMSIIQLFNALFLDLIQAAFIISFVLFVELLSWKKSRVILVELVPLFIIALLAALGYSHMANEFDYNLQVEPGDSVFFFSIYPMDGHSYSYPVNRYALYRFDAAIAGNVNDYNGLSDRERLKTPVSVCEKEVARAGAKVEKAYHVFGDAQSAQLQSEFFELLLVPGNEEASELTVSADRCMPYPRILAVDFLSANCESCIVYGRLFWTHQDCSAAPSGTID